MTVSASPSNERGAIRYLQIVIDSHRSHGDVIRGVNCDLANKILAESNLAESELAALEAEIAQLREESDDNAILRRETAATMEKLFRDAAVREDDIRVKDATNVTIYEELQRVEAENADLRARLAAAEALDVAMGALRGLGCGDGGCYVERPSGMHTNGGCRCLTPLPMKLRHGIQRVLLAARVSADASKERKDHD